MGVSESSSFTFAERNEFQRAFDAVTARIPKMFRSFVHHWAEEPGLQPSFVIHAEDGSLVLRITRMQKGSYRAQGVTKDGTIIYGGSEPSISSALRASGLL